jgi:hypothetical protein
VRPLYAVIDENGTHIHAAESKGHGQMAIAREFGISFADLDDYGAKKRSSKSFMAFISADGRFREIISSPPRMPYRK